MTTVEKYQEAGIIPQPHPQSLGEMVVTFGNLAAQICKTDFVPENFRNKPEAVLACMLFGQEVGLGPMASLNLTNSIKGKVGLSPEGMRGIVTSHGHRIWPEEYTAERVTLCGQRKGDDVVVKVTWTLDDATRAEIGGGASWKKYPRAMLLARATSELCRLHFADVVGGLAYGEDELEEIGANRHIVDASTGEILPKPAAKSKAKTVKDEIADPTVKLLIDDLNAIPEEEARIEAKKEFLARFKLKRPEDLKPDQYEEAAAFVASVTF